MSELVFDCVMHFHSDLNPAVSLVSKKYFEIDSLTRKHLTVHVLYLPDPKRVFDRFPNIESLSLKSHSYGDKSYPRRVCSEGRFSPNKCRIRFTPWIQEIAKLESLQSLSIRNMVVFPFDLQLLAKTLGASLRSLEIRGCKMSSDEGLDDIALCCTDLRSLRLENNAIEYYGSNDGKWLRELALCNTGVMESIALNEPFENCSPLHFTLLAKKCGKSLVSLDAFNSFGRYLDNFQEFFKHANKLERFRYVAIDEQWNWDSSDFKFPQTIRSLGIDDWREASFPFLPPYLNQLRELDLKNRDFDSNCQCDILKSCPNLEVLHTQDTCGDKGLKVIGQFCSRLRKLKHAGGLTQLGLIAVAQGCPDLEYLEVSPLDISNIALEYVGTHLKNLRDFRILLASEDGITDSPLDKGVLAMLIGCSKLERLDFGLCSGGLTDVGLGYVGKYGHNLRSLFLKHTGDVGLRELLKGCPKLRKLKLNGYPFNEQAIASFVFSINQSVRYVWLKYGSPDVSVLTRPKAVTRTGRGCNVAI